MTSNDIAELFAALTCLFEDMHAIAVEGQRADLSPDMARVLAAQVRTGLVSAGRLIGMIDRAAL